MASTMTWRRRTLTVVPPILLGISVAGCTEEHWSEPHSSGDRLHTDRPECPQTYDTIPLFPVKDPRTAISGTTPSSGPVPGASALSAPGPITDIPEFHDCQKFVVRDPDGRQRFDSLYAIFAAFKLDTIAPRNYDTVTWTSSNPAVAAVTATGVVTGVAAGTASIIATSTAEPSRKATVSVTVSPGALTPDSAVVTVSVTTAFLLRTAHVFFARANIGAPTPTTLPVAEIYTYGSGYGPLGIGPNFSCLYLYFADNGNLVAKMVNMPLGPDLKACFEAVDPRTAGGTPLGVIRTSGLPDAAYPAVARWDWDPVNEQHYIGLKCGSGWCEVGRGAADGQPMSLSPVYKSASAAAPTPQEVGVKGWYDEQFLAVAGPGGTLVPSGLRATVIPHQKLKTHTPNEFRGSWAQVAYIALDTAPGSATAAKHYKDKFNFDPAPVRATLDHMNSLSLCYGTRSDCQVPAPPAGLGCGPDTKPPFIWRIKRWWARIDAANGGNPMYQCVTRRDHEAAVIALNIDMPPTTRWRWLGRDDTTWDFCPAVGCCETRGYGGW